MARDRGAILTVRACRRGVVDFGRARLRDPRWWRRSNALIEDMAAEDDIRLLDAAYQHQLALIANAQLTEDSWKHAKQEAVELFNDLVNLIHPWGARSRAERRQEDVNQAVDLYRKVIGDYRDPTFKAVVDAQVETMKAQMRQSNQEALASTQFERRLAEQRQNPRKQGRARAW